MSRINYRIIIGYFLVFVLAQLPLLYKYVLFESVIGFFYIGFLLFLPFGLRPFLKLSIGFFIGLLIDMFTNTPGMHAAASTLLMFVRDFWLVTSTGEPDDSSEISVYTLGLKGLVAYVLPLVFIHHLVLFSIEHGSMHAFFPIIGESILSAFFTFFTLVVVNFLMASKPRRT
ncbi:MAG: hypothetical protein OEY56_04585 [Cyclobacteriaceae bacterium]|nr:hypothetical protein [Cyclobacteriaceae bacterium]